MIACFLIVCILLTNVWGAAGGEKPAFLDISMTKKSEKLLEESADVISKYNTILKTCFGLTKAGVPFAKRVHTAIVCSCVRVIDPEFFLQKEGEIFTESFDLLYAESLKRLFEKMEAKGYCYLTDEARTSSVIPYGFIGSKHLLLSSAEITDYDAPYIFVSIKNKNISNAWIAATRSLAIHNESVDCVRFAELLRELWQEVFKKNTPPNLFRILQSSSKG